ncbi:MAG: methyl-accepting chemotaxis protein [Spirochaetia bacterium]
MHKSKGLSFFAKVVFINLFVSFLGFIHNQIILWIYSPFSTASVAQRFIHVFTQNTSIFIFLGLAIPISIGIAAFISPAERAIRDENKQKQAEKRIKQLPFLLVAIYPLAFALGPIVGMTSAHNEVFIGYGAAIILTSLSTGFFCFTIIYLKIEEHIFYIKRELKMFAINDTKHLFSIITKLLISVLSSVALTVSIVYMIGSYYAIVGNEAATGSMLVNALLNIFILHIPIVYQIYLASGTIIKSVNLLRQNINDLAIGKVSLKSRTPIPSYDELGHLISDFNDFMDFLTNDVMLEIQSSTEVVSASIKEVSSAAQDIAATSNEQASSAKEIVATMEDAQQLSNSISQKIDEVTRVSRQTKDRVEEGSDTIKQTLDKMNQIRESNASTITGIKTLGEQIDSIWDIVNIINNIADQTKIIAFNAELEASSAGDVGKNFEIVASEIRRLADNTVESTQEIKNKINEIASSSDNLIMKSEEGTLRVQEGWELSKKAGTVFEEIIDSSEVSAQSSENIAESVKHQVSSFQQVLAAIKQISDGIDSFVQSTQLTQSTVNELKALVDNLNKMVDRYLAEE